MCACACVYMCARVRVLAGTLQDLFTLTTELRLLPVFGTVILVLINDLVYILHYCSVGDAVENR